MEAARPVFYVSDGTGITAETIGHSLLTQFSGLRFATDRLPFVDSADKAREAAKAMAEAQKALTARSATTRRPLRASPTACPTP